jgi:hypothetical protein
MGNSIRIEGSTEQANEFDCATEQSIWSTHEFPAGRPDERLFTFSAANPQKNAHRGENVQPGHGEIMTPFC